MKKKNRNDKVHCKGGMVGGNVRHKRAQPTKRMGKARNSIWWKTTRQVGDE